MIPFYVCSLFALLYHCDLQANERHVYTIFMFSGGIEGHHTETLGTWLKG